MTSLSPGHNPPQVTIAAVVLAGSWKILLRAPARSKTMALSVPSSVGSSKAMICLSSGVNFRSPNLLRSGESMLHSPRLATGLKANSGINHHPFQCSERDTNVCSTTCFLRSSLHLLEPPNNRQRPHERRGVVLERLR